MVRPDFAKWNESAELMRELSIEDRHPRSRERYQALYMVGSKQFNARQWAQATSREDETILRWIHQYNEGGSNSVGYQHSGGVLPMFSLPEQREMVNTVLTSKPIDHQQLGHGWNLKKLRRWVEDKLQRKVSRNPLRTILKQAGFSWKKCKKLLQRAKPEQRTEFVEQFQSVYERMCRDEVMIIYLDEAHIHQDMDDGYSWSPVGEPTWVRSTSPGLSARINWYGAYNFSTGRCFLWQGETCDSEHTIQFLEQLAQWLGKTDSRVVIIWDNASHHKKQSVQEAAKRLGFELFPLPLIALI